MTPLRLLPRGALASTVTGLAAGSLAWLIDGAWPALIAGYTRLDQLTMLTLGAVVGGALLAMRARRRREAVSGELLIGAVAGGVGALIGTTVTAWLPPSLGTSGFLAARILTWALAAGATALALALVQRHRLRRVALESACIAAVGGAIAGLIFSLPGAADLWQAVAFAWSGALIGFAVAGPELWRAPAVVELVPPRRTPSTIGSLREWSLYDGEVVSLGEVQLACHRGVVAIYPPAGGVVANEAHVHRPQYFAAGGSVTAGRSTYRVRVDPPAR